MPQGLDPASARADRRRRRFQEATPHTNLTKPRLLTFVTGHVDFMSSRPPEDPRTICSFASVSLAGTG
jgi:hypothetical protein